MNISFSDELQYLIFPIFGIIGEPSSTSEDHYLSLPHTAEIFRDEKV